MHAELQLAQQQFLAALLVREQRRSALHTAFMAHKKISSDAFSVLGPEESARAM